MRILGCRECHEINMYSTKTHTHTTIHAKKHDGNLKTGKCQLGLYVNKRLKIGD